MTDPADDAVPLSEMIEHLRRELQTSLAAGRDEPVRFAVDKVELELKVAVGRKGKGEAGVAFWVVKAGASGELSQDRSHTFKLTLTPHAAGGAPMVLTTATGATAAAAASTTPARLLIGDAGGAGDSPR